MKKTQIIGIDVSKAKLDVWIHSTHQHFTVQNDTTGFAKLLEAIFTSTKCKKQDLLFCFENTGKYSKMLSVFLHSQEILFVMAPALEIKKSLGITRGKNDKIDARRIARYAYEKRDRLVPTVLPGEKIDKLKSLLSLREKLIKHRTAYKNGITDLKDCYTEGETIIIKEVQQRLINAVNDEVRNVEEEVAHIIKMDPLMDRNFNLITSVKGIGKILGFYLIAFTENFTAFIDARSFACFAGTAPFANSSGTVIGKSRVHPYANKQIKSLLNMAAMSAIQLKGEYREYYNKRLEIGKNKMSSLNIIRNKILFRVFAVVKRGSPYVDLYRYAA
ncbi:MAG: IS110 family transposase [Bacteroidetes bacterium]|nr:IS110 family transposase [Bacteroidota bacterium]